MDNNNKIKMERIRLKALLNEAQVSKQHQDALAPLIDNLAWMRVKLEDVMLEIEDASVVVPYDNGGGQSGIRENPIFKGYNALWRSYMNGLEKFVSVLPKDLKDQIVNEGQTVLDRVKQMKESK